MKLFIYLWITPEGFQHNHFLANKSNNEFGKTGFFMAKLLSGKKPLVNKKMAKESAVSTTGSLTTLPQSSCSSSSTINQSMLRARFNRSIYPGSSVVQSSFVYPNVSKSKDSTDNNNLKMETNTDPKEESIDGKPTYQVVAIQPVTTDNYFSFNPCISEYFSKRQSSSSSTSTELCDEIIGINNNYDEDDNDSVYTLEDPMQFSTNLDTDQLDRNEKQLIITRRNSKSLDNIYNIVTIRQQMEYDNLKFENDDDKKDLSDHFYSTFTTNTNYYSTNRINNDSNNKVIDSDDKINSNSKNKLDESVLDQTIKKFQEQINQIKFD